MIINHKGDIIMCIKHERSYWEVFYVQDIFSNILKLCCMLINNIAEIFISRMYGYRYILRNAFRNNGNNLGPISRTDFSLVMGLSLRLWS